MIAWLSLEALRIWVEHGPGRTLVGPASHVAFVAVALRGDYPAGYRAMRRILALGEARGYEPDTSQARFLFALLAAGSSRSRTASTPASGPARGCSRAATWPTPATPTTSTVPHLLDCAPSLDSFVAEVEAGLAFVRRTGSEQTGQWLDSYRWLAGVLRGESSAAAGEAVPADRYADNPAGAVPRARHPRARRRHLRRPAGLARHTAAAMPLLPAVPGIYPAAVAHLLRGLALAGQARARPR